MVRFNRTYFLLAVVLFITEVLIALFVHDAIVRPYIGDVLVVILIYCTIQAFFNVPVKACAIGVLLFAFTIELLQYFKIVKLLGLMDHPVARVVIGTSFAWTDLLAYIAGVVIILVWENRLLKSSKN